MMRQIKEETEIQKLLHFLHKDVENCLYLYIDLKQYGLTNPNIRVWADGEASQWNLVVMKYHEGFQIYAPDDKWALKELLDLIKQYKPERISGNESVIALLEQVISEKYQTVYGKIFKGIPGQFQAESGKRLVELAKISDAAEIAELLLTDAEFRRQYSKKELTEQLEERYRTKMGRSMIIRDNGRIIGHVGTFAEAEGLAVISGALILKEYRNTDYHVLLSQELLNLLCSIEKRDAFFS